MTCLLNQSVINQPAHTNAPVIYTALLPPIIKDGIIQTNEKAQSISGKQDHQQRKYHQIKKRITGCYPE